MPLMLVLFSGLLSEFRRAEACLLSENARKIRRVVIVELVGYLLGRQVGIGEQASGFEQYPLHDHLAGVLPRLRFDEFVEVFGCHVHHAGIVANHVYLPEMPFDEIPEPAQRQKSGIVDRLLIKIISVEKVTAFEQEDMQIAAQHILPYLRIAREVLAQMAEDIEQFVKILIIQVEHGLRRVIIEKRQGHQQVFISGAHRIKLP